MSGLKQSQPGCELRCRAVTAIILLVLFQNSYICLPVPAFGHSMPQISYHSVSCTAKQYGHGHYSHCLRSFRHSTAPVARHSVSTMPIPYMHIWCPISELKLQKARKPPSTSRDVPVMKLASSDARKATAAATSSGFPNLQSIEHAQVGSFLAPFKVFMKMIMLSGCDQYHCE